MAYMLQYQIVVDSIVALEILDEVRRNVNYG